MRGARRAASFRAVGDASTATRCKLNLARAARRFTDGAAELENAAMFGWPTGAQQDFPLDPLEARMSVVPWVYIGRGICSRILRCQSFALSGHQNISVGWVSRAIVAGVRKKPSGSSSISAVVCVAWAAIAARFRESAWLISKSDGFRFMTARIVVWTTQLFKPDCIFKHKRMATRAANSRARQCP